MFYQNDVDGYIGEIKAIISESFIELNYSDYAKIKQLRKLVRIMNKHIKFVSDKRQETELLLYFCNMFIEKRLYRTKLKALKNIFVRQYVRIAKCIAKMEEDLQFDYSKELENLEEKIKVNKISFE